MKIYCIMCKQPLHPARREQIGICQETGEYTLDEEKATQGWFDVGRGCLDTWKKNQEEGK